MFFQQKCTRVSCLCLSGSLDCSWTRSKSRPIEAPNRPTFRRSQEPQYHQRFPSHHGTLPSAPAKLCFRSTYRYPRRSTNSCPVPYFLFTFLSLQLSDISFPTLITSVLSLYPFITFKRSFRTSFRSVTKMWFLCEDNPDHTPPPRYWLGGVSNQNGRTIGRKHVDIRLRASSVSRNHARLVVQKAPFYGHPRPHRQTTTVSIIDTSAYGTFLKYPEGHIRSRKDGHHHCRLDKNTPVQIFDGALLSFGAPAAWWRLVWHEMVLIPSRLSSTQRQRLSDIATQTGIDVAKDWIQSPTHVITNTCDPRSIIFLHALVCQVAVVTPAWVEATFEVVANACRSVTDAPDLHSAEHVTRLPYIYHYIPPFDANYVEPYGDEIIDGVFDDERITERPTLFANVIFAFNSEKLRSKWVSVITDCSGKTCGTVIPPSVNHDADAQQGQPRIIRIKDDSSVECEGSEPHFDESALILAILKADLCVFDEGPVKSFSQPISKKTDSDIGKAAPCKSEVESPKLSENASQTQSTGGVKRARFALSEPTVQGENDEHDAQASGDFNQPTNKRVCLKTESEVDAAKILEEIGINPMRKPTGEKSNAPLAMKKRLSTSVGNASNATVKNGTSHSGTVRPIVEESPNLDDDDDDGLDIEHGGIGSVSLPKLGDMEVENANVGINSLDRLGALVLRSDGAQGNVAGVALNGEWILPESLKGENEADLVPQDDEGDHDHNERQFFKVEERPALQEVEADSEEGVQHNEDVRPFRGTAVAMAGRMSLNVVSCLDTCDES